MSILENIDKPWELERDLKNEPDIDRKIDHVTNAVGKLLEELKTKESYDNILRLKENPFDKQLAFSSLFGLYTSLFMVAKKVIDRTSGFGSPDKVKLGNKTAAQVLNEAVNKMIFSHEKDELLAPVSADLGKKKGDYGPAMYSEYVKRAGRNLISSINNQINDLLPTVTKICQGFSGISNKFVSRETRSKGEREKFEDIWLIYQAEKAAMERIAEIASITKDKVVFFQDLLNDFSHIKKAYQEKIESLAYLAEQTQNSLDEVLRQGEETTEKLDLESQLFTLGEKTKKLHKGNEKLHEMERLLLTLNNLINRFPAIESQIEFFIESDFQAKSVYKFLEEINQEMKGVFGQQNIQAFEVIGALVYKLKSTSLMYDNANYYQAATRMSDDVLKFLQRKLGEEREPNIKQKAAAGLRASGLKEGVQNIHLLMTHVKELNNKIHLVLVEFGNRLVVTSENGKSAEEAVTTRDELQSKLEKYLVDVKKLSEERILSQYRKCQKQFQDFIEINLEEKQIGEQVLRSFLDQSSKGETPPLKKEELLNFQKFKLYTKMLPDTRVQRFYSDALKKFMRGEPCDEIFPTNIRLQFVSEITEIEEIENKYPENPSRKGVSKHETAINFIAENVTPKEIENLARFVPCMPRNELRLTYPPGKLFIDIAEKHMEFIRAQSLRQFVLINPGEERKNENEILFKELAGKELIKKAYNVLHRHLEPVFQRIKEEKGREEDFINRERSKWRRELDQIILHLQYQINALSSENLVEEGTFRIISAEERALMAKYISTDQFDKLESLFGKKYEVDKDSVLAEVEVFLIQTIQAFYQIMEKDELIKAAFEETQEEARKMHLGGKVDNIARKIKEVETLIRQKNIDRLFEFWEYGINKILPNSEQTLKDEIEQTHYSQEDLTSMAFNILPDQLHRIKGNLGVIRNNANQKQQPILMSRGKALMKIAQACFDIIEKDEAMVQPHEEAYRQRLADFKGEDTFRDEIDQILSSIPAGLHESDGAGERKSGGGKSTTETTALNNIDRLITAYKVSLSDGAVPANLPKISSTNLNAYVKFISTDQIGEIAAIAKDRIRCGQVNSAEKRFLIIAYNHLKENPMKGSKEERKQIVLRFKEISSGKS